jgi:hypothetical protein
MPTRFPVTTRSGFTKASGAGPNAALSQTYEEARFNIAAKECVAPTAPTNSVAPARSGTAQVGQTLSCTQGTWAGTNIVYEYEWQRNYGDGQWNRIMSGNGASTYVCVAADVGSTLRCTVIARNGGNPVKVSTTASATVIA